MSERPTAARRATLRAVLPELGFVAVGLLLYLAVGRHTSHLTDEAIANAERVLRLERALGIDWEHAIQDAALAVPGLAAFSTHFYVWGYLPVMVGTTVWMYVRHPESYPRLRNALLASGAVGLVVYALFPCAPPWIVGGFTDTVTTHSLTFAARPLGITNHLGAVPSFHCGWLILLGVVVYAATTSRVLRVLCVAVPLVMCLVVVATGNHWVLDIPAGAALAAVGLGAARVVSRWTGRSRDRPRNGPRNGPRKGPSDPRGDLRPAASGPPAPPSPPTPQPGSRRRPGARS